MILDEQRPYQLWRIRLHRFVFEYKPEPARRHKPTKLGLDSLNKSPVLSSSSLSISVCPGLPFQLVSPRLHLLHGLRSRPAKNSQGTQDFLFHHRSETTIRQNEGWLAVLLGAGLFRSPMRNLDLAL